MSQIVWITEPKIFTIWTSKEKVYQPLIWTKTYYDPYSKESVCSTNSEQFTVKEPGLKFTNTCSLISLQGFIFTAVTEKPSTELALLSGTAMKNFSCMSELPCSKFYYFPGSQQVISQRHKVLAIPNW